MIARQALIPYFTLGDPSVAVTEQLVSAAFENGAAAVELGLPFSDPVADGPVIQASHQRVLEQNPNIGVAEALSVVKKMKKKYAKPIIIMGATNLIFHFGIEKFFSQAGAAGLDGVILPDLPLEEASEYRKEAKRHGVKMIFLVSPLCDESRLKKIVAASEGFVYLISSTGTTGERADISATLGKLAKKIKAIKNIPVAVGFGISKKEHLETVFQFAEGAIIGSLFVRAVEKHLQRPQAAVEEIARTIRDFTTPFSIRRR